MFTELPQDRFRLQYFQSGARTWRIGGAQLLHLLSDYQPPRHVTLLAVCCCFLGDNLEQEEP